MEDNIIVKNIDYILSNDERKNEFAENLGMLFVQALLYKKIDYVFTNTLEEGYIKFSWNEKSKKKEYIKSEIGLPAEDPSKESTEHDDVSSYFNDIFDIDKSEDMTEKFIYDLISKNKKKLKSAYFPYPENDCYTLKDIFAKTESLMILKYIGLLYIDMYIKKDSINNFKRYVLQPHTGDTAILIEPTPIGSIEISLLDSSDGPIILNSFCEPWYGFKRGNVLDKLIIGVENHRFKDISIEEVLEYRSNEDNDFDNIVIYGSKEHTRRYFSKCGEKIVDSFNEGLRENYFLHGFLSELHGYYLLQHAPFYVTTYAEQDDRLTNDTIDTVRELFKNDKYKQALMECLFRFIKGKKEEEFWLNDRDRLDMLFNKKCDIITFTLYKLSRKRHLVIEERGNPNNINNNHDSIRDKQIEYDSLEIPLKEIDKLLPRYYVNQLKQHSLKISISSEKMLVNYHINSFLDSFNNELVSKLYPEKDYRFDDDSFNERRYGTDFELKLRLNDKEKKLHILLTKRYDDKMKDYACITLDNLKDFEWLSPNVRNKLKKRFEGSNSYIRKSLKEGYLDNCVHTVLLKHENQKLWCRCMEDKSLHIYLKYDFENLSMYFTNNYEGKESYDSDDKVKESHPWYKSELLDDLTIDLTNDKQVNEFFSNEDIKIISNLSEAVKEKRAKEKKENSYETTRAFVENMKDNVKNNVYQKTKELLSIVRKNNLNCLSGIVNVNEYQDVNISIDESKNITYQLIDKDTNIPVDDKVMVSSVTNEIIQ